MSCWTRGVKTTHAGLAATGAPVQPGMPVAAPNKCPICGWFTTRSGACVNPDCGEHAQTLQAAGAPGQPAPAPFVTFWTTQSASGFSPEARAYLRSLGCSALQVAQRLQARPPEVWMYLPRCETCGAWVSPRLGICKNPRCSGGRVGGSTNRRSKPGAWQWPPQEVSLEHVQAALGRPDAHTAWHSRDADLAATIELGAFLPNLLDLRAEIVAHVRQGHERGWLDPEDPAYDVDAQRRLEEAVDQGLRGNADSVAVTTGNWTALGLQYEEDVRRLLNPVLTPKQRAALQVQADETFDAAAQNETQADMLARRCIRSMGAALGQGVVPALPPRGIRPSLRKRMRRGLHVHYTFLTNPRTHFVPATASHEIYAWISKVRLAPPGWQPSPNQRFRAVRALQRFGQEAGYDGPLTPTQAEAIFDNGWSPAEARHAQRHADNQRESI